MGRLSRRQFVVGVSAAGVGLLAGCGPLLTYGSLCRQQGRSLLDFLMAAGEAVRQGPAAPSLLPTRLG
jgi:hypothetical protein